MNVKGMGGDGPKIAVKSTEKSIGAVAPHHHPVSTPYLMVCTSRGGPTTALKPSGRKWTVDPVKIGRSCGAPVVLPY